MMLGETDYLAAKELFKNIDASQLTPQIMEEALVLVNRALSANPEYPKANILRGELLNRLNRLVDACRAFELAKEQLAQQGAVSFEVYCGLADVSFKLNSYQEAVILYRQSLKLQPSYLRASIGLGAALLKLNQNQEALQCYEQAVVELNKLAPIPSELNVYIASIYLSVGTAHQNTPQNFNNYFQASLAYHTALNFRPNWEPALTAIQHVQPLVELEAHMYYSQGLEALTKARLDSCDIQYSLAKDCFNHVLTRLSNWPEAQSLCSMAALELEQLISTKNRAVNVIEGNKTNLDNSLNRSRGVEDKEAIEEGHKPTNTQPTIPQLLGANRFGFSYHEEQPPKTAEKTVLDNSPTAN